MQVYRFVRIDIPFYRLLIKIYIDMEDKKHSFMDQLNLFFIGAVIGVIVGACFGINAVKGSNNRAEKK